MNTEYRPRLPFIDALKALTSQVIVLHHLALYGPLARAAHQATPALIDWLTRETRIVVQIFLVIGGFLATNSLAPDGRLATPNPLRQIKKRYLKLTIPFVFALLISIVCAAIARRLCNAPFIDPFIPDAPTLAQFLAHAALLHGALGVDSLSAGVWYVAIDFQLFTLLLGLLWLARRPGLDAERQRTFGLWFIAALAVASLFHFNRQAEWDNWAIYFFGAYALGALAFRFSSPPEADRPNGHDGLSSCFLMALGALAAIVGLALWIDFRTRILLALMTALALAIARRTGILARWPNSALLAWLGQISYAVFLIHFPVLLIVNGLFARMMAQTPAAGLVGMALAWLLSIGAGALFHQHIERRSFFGRMPSRI